MDAAKPSETIVKLPVEPNFCEECKTMFIYKEEFISHLRKKNHSQHSIIDKTMNCFIKAQHGKAGLMSDLNKFKNDCVVHEAINTPSPLHDVTNDLNEKDLAAIKYITLPPKNELSNKSSDINIYLGDNSKKGETAMNSVKSSLKPTSTLDFEREALMNNIYESEKLSDAEISRIFEFAATVESSISTLMVNQISDDSWKNIFILNKSVIPNRNCEKIVCGYSRIDVLAAEIFLQNDTVFHILILVDPSILPTEFTYEFILHKFEEIYNDKYKSCGVILPPGKDYCRVKHLYSNISISLSLISRGWRDDTVLCDNIHIEFSLLDNRRELDSLEFSEWYKYVSRKDDRVKKLCILVRSIVGANTTLSQLGLWYYFILSVNVINSFPKPVGLFEYIRKIFSILSSGIVLEDGESISDPCNLLQKLATGLTREVCCDLTYICQHILILISTSKLTAILHPSSNI